MYVKCGWHVMISKIVSLSCGVICYQCQTGEGTRYLAKTDVRSSLAMDFTKPVAATHEVKYQPASLC